MEEWLADTQGSSDSGFSIDAPAPDDSLLFWDDLDDDALPFSDRLLPSPDTDGFSLDMLATDGFLASDFNSELLPNLTGPSLLSFSPSPPKDLVPCEAAIQVQSQLSQIDPMYHFGSAPITPMLSDVFPDSTPLTDLSFFGDGIQDGIQEAIQPLIPDDQFLSTSLAEHEELMLQHSVLVPVAEPSIAIQNHDPLETVSTDRPDSFVNMLEDAFFQADFDENAEGGVDIEVGVELNIGKDAITMPGTQSSRQPSGSLILNHKPLKSAAKLKAKQASNKRQVSKPKKDPNAPKRRPGRPRVAFGLNCLKHVKVLHLPSLYSSYFHSILNHPSLSFLSTHFLHP